MVPHATEGFEARRRSSSINPAPQKFKFPDFHQESAIIDDGEDISRGPSPRPLPNGLPPGLHSSERWPAAKRDSNRSSLAGWAANGFVGKTRHGRQKSLSEAIHTIRTRGRTASISENAHEIAESLKAPVSFKLVVGSCLCIHLQSGLIVRSSSVPSGTPHPSLRTPHPRPS